MQDFGTKADNSPPPGGQLSAVEFNNLATENENAVLRSGQSLSGASATQLATSLFLHGVKSGTFQDSGAVNAYVITPVSGASGVLLPSTYSEMNGAVIQFRAANANTGASTLNIGQTTGALLGTKAIVDQYGSPLISGAFGPNLIQLRYDSSIGAGSWVLLPWSGGGRLLRTTAYAIISGTQQTSINGGAFTATGATTFSTLPMTGFYRYRIVGAGGAGGGAQGTAAGQQSVGGGGGAGGYSEGIGTAALVGVAVSVGAGGILGAAGLVPGGSGGSSSVSTLASATGGAGGGAGSALSVFPGITSGGVAGFGTGGSLVNSRGVAGGIGLNAASANVASGNGGASVLGGGGQAVGGTGFGSASNTYGAGGSGGVCFASVAGGAAGGAGGAGYVEFSEYV